MSAPCPRCSAPITGDYRFCPTCAYRLRPGPAEPPPAPVSSWKGRIVTAAITAALLACALVGVFLFHPEWISSKPGPAPVPTPPPPPTSRPYTVDDIPDDLVLLKRMGAALTFPAVLFLDPKDPVQAAHIDRLPSGPDDGEPEITAYVWYGIHVMRHEVTRGQYAEFIEDLQEHPDRVDNLWVELDGVSGPQAVDLLRHVPPSWQGVDRFGEPSWRLPAPDRNLPVTEVSFFDAIAFANWLSNWRLRERGLVFDLPAHVEWIRAARGGRLDYLWPWGERRRLYACNNAGVWPHEPPRPLPVDHAYSEDGLSPDGLRDMAGNVREWAREHDLVVWTDPTGDLPPGLRWGAYRKSETAQALGGSFRSAIDDCRVTPGATAVSPYRRDRFDDLGFRLIVRHSE